MAKLGVHSARFSNTVLTFHIAGACSPMLMVAIVEFAYHQQHALAALAGGDLLWPTHLTRFTTSSRRLWRPPPDVKDRRVKIFKAIRRRGGHSDHQYAKVARFKFTDVTLADT